MLHDRDIREPLFDFLESEYGKVRILEEKAMGRSRADVVMVTEEALVGIEIKSDADTYSRLSRQIKDYDRYYDSNIVVVGTSHVMHIEERIPEYWGIITVEFVDGVLDFYMLRKPKSNPKRERENKLQILWKSELFVLQQILQMPKYKDKKKDFVIGKICSMVPERISPEDLDREVSHLLFERDYTKASEMISEYRKGELQKAIDRESDPLRRLELMMEQKEKSRNLKHKKRSRRTR